MERLGGFDEGGGWAVDLGEAAAGFGNAGLADLTGVGVEPDARLRSRTTLTPTP